MLASVQDACICCYHIPLQTITKSSPESKLFDNRQSSSVLPRVEPGEIGLVGLEATGDGLDQHGVGRSSVVPTPPAPPAARHPAPPAPGSRRLSDGSRPLAVFTAQCTGPVLLPAPAGLVDSGPAR